MHDEYGNYTVVLSVTDSDDITIRDSTWSKIIDNNPPFPPNIDGPKIGKPGISYTYTFFAHDVEEEDVYLWIEWGDGDILEWIGPFASSEEVNLNHSWAEKGDYLIKAKAKDINDAESDWNEFQVTIPRVKNANNFILRLLELIQNTFPILSYLLSI